MPPDSLLREDEGCFPPNHEKHDHAMLALREHGMFTEADEDDIKDRLAEIERTCKKGQRYFLL